MRAKNKTHSYYVLAGGVAIASIFMLYIGILISHPEWIPVFMRSPSFDVLGNYNTLIQTRGMSGDIDRVRSLSMSGYDADMRELMGDAIMARSGSRERALVYYRESLLYSDRARVREKIDILSSVSGEGVAPPPSSPGSISTGASIASGYTDLIDTAKARIESDGIDRGRYLEHTLSPAHIREEIEFLEIGEERMDW